MVLGMFVLSMVLLFLYPPFGTILLILSIIAIKLKINKYWEGSYYNEMSLFSI